MSVITSEITGISIVYSTVCWGADQTEHQSSTSLVFVNGIHRWPVDSPHKEQVTGKMFPFDDIIMDTLYCNNNLVLSWVLISHNLPCISISTSLGLCLHAYCSNTWAGCWDFYQTPYLYTEYIPWNIRADSRFGPANERVCYFVMTFLIGWVQA